MIDTLEALDAIYGIPSCASLDKEVDRLTPTYRRLIEASPFLALATCGPEGLDCSPRGDDGQVVYVLDDKTLALPDRRGNNRLDSLRNIVRDPRVGLMFLLPGSGTCLRVNGRAVIHDDKGLLSRFEMRGKPPRTVVVVTIDTIYFQCARAVMRAGLWDVEKQLNVNDLPSVGEVLSEVTGGKFDGEKYDKEWPERAKTSMW